MMDDEQGEPVPMAAWAYAFDKVGFMVLPETRGRFTADELVAWDEAVQEFLEREDEGNGTE